MRFPHWLRPLATRLNPGCKRRARLRPAFRPRLETLEERTLLSNYTAGTVTDLIGDINLANAVGGTNTITLTAGASSPYILDNTTGALPEITAGDNLTINTIDGANRTIERLSSASAFRLFTVDSGASLNLQNLTLTGGLADQGGAIFNLGILAINICTIADNSVTDLDSDNDFNGGGIYNGGTASINSSTLSGNSTISTSGAGIYNSGTVNISNSTLADNSGEGMVNVGTVNVSNSTVAGNSFSGIFNEFGGSATLNNTIVADNNTSSLSIPPVPDLYGDGDYRNTFSGSNDIIGGNPLLAPLGNYGGPTQTMALLPGSPAIDAGNNALAVDANGNLLTTDQRGQPRIVGNTVDIGAFESQGFTLTASSGSNQSAIVHTMFLQPLTVTVTANNPLEPVDGGRVTFTAPNSGASAALLSYSYPTLIAGGSAALTAQANGNVGSYTVTATASGAGTPVDFSLSNAPLVVKVVNATDHQLTSFSFVSGPTNWTPVGSTLYFEADDGNGNQIWRTDGQPEDTVAVDNGSQPYDRVAQADSWLYFFTDNGNGTYTLWRNDSAASPSSSSQMVLQNIQADPTGAGPYQLTAVSNGTNTDLYFGAYSSNDGKWELWKVAGANGASPNTAPCQLDQIDSNGPSNIFAAGSNLYFAADAPHTTNGGLWESDGTTAGTKLVQDGSGNPFTAAMSDEIAVGSDLYTITGGEGTLWRISGQQATAIATVGGEASNYLQLNGYHMTVAGNTLYFISGGPNGGYDVWKCVGSTATKIFDSTNYGAADGPYVDPIDVAVSGPDVYFTDAMNFGTGGNYASHLWMSDGSPGGTELLKTWTRYDAGGSTFNVPYGLTAVGSSVYVDGPDGQLWQSEGSAESTQLTGITLGKLGESQFGGQGTSTSPNPNSPLVALGSTLYFSSDSGAPGAAGGPLWRLNNPPVLNSAVSSAADTSISGTFSETADANTTITLTFYANTVAAPSGAGPGQTSLGSTTVTTDANGNAVWTADLAVGNLAGQWITATATDANGYTSDFAFDVQATTASSQTYAQYLQAALPKSSSTANTMTIQASASNIPATVISAVSGLTNVSQPVTITLDLGGGTYSLGSLVYNPADASNAQNVTFVIENGTLQGSLTVQGGNVQLKNVILDPDSPALTVAGGQVLLSGCTLTTTGDAPTLLVTGGNVTLVNDAVIQASTVYSDPAIAVTGGTVNLGTAATPGNNSLSVNSSSSLVSNSSGLPISAVGTTFIAGGTVLPSLPLSFTSITSSATTTVYGQAVTFTAAVQPDGSGTPSGSVDFVDTTTNTDLGSRQLSGGLATLTTSALNAGTHIIVARYGGDSTFLPSTVSLSQTVNPATPTLTVADVGGVYNGQPFTASATVAGVIAGVDSTPSGSLEGGTPTLSYYSGTYTDPSQLASLTALPGAPTNAGSYTVLASFPGSTDYTSTQTVTNFTVAQATPVFGAVSTTVITDGTPSVTLSGSLTSASLVLTGKVTVVIDGVSQTVSIGPGGGFSATFNTASLRVAVHTITFSYGGDTNFTSANATASLDDTYKVVALFNQTKAKSPGSVLPIQIALDTASNQDVSNSGVTVTALGLAATTDTADTVGSIDPSQLGALTAVQAAGTANPGNVFRYQGGNNPFYMYNLQIPTGLTAGTYRLYFSVAGDPLDHWVTFTVD